MFGFTQISLELSYLNRWMKFAECLINSLVLNLQIAKKEINYCLLDLSAIDNSTSYKLQIYITQTLSRCLQMAECEQKWHIVPYLPNQEM